MKTGFISANKKGKVTSVTEFTSSNLSNEEISRVFAMYFNERVMFDDRIGNICTFYMPAGKFEVGKVWCVSLEEDKEGSELSCSVDCNKVQLLLTPLSAIIDEHALQIAKITNILPYGWDGPNGHYTINKLDHPNTGIEVKCNSYSVRIMINASVYFYDDSRPNLAMSISSAPLVYQYLIQQGYAVPLFFGVDHWANGKTAIELGIAIEKYKNDGYDCAPIDFSKIKDEPKQWAE